MPVTALLTTDNLDAATLNARLNQLQTDINNILAGTLAQTAPAVSSFTNAQHTHQNAAGGGQLTPAAISSSGYSSGQVMQANGSGGWTALTLALLPTGVMVPFAGPEGSIPTGWLLCAGQAVSRSTYSALFALLATTYGAGDGSTTFNLPNLRGRIPVGLDNMGGTSANVITGTWADNLGQTGGAETHTLSIAEMPAHTHPLTNINAGDRSPGGGGTHPIGTTGATQSTGGGGAHNNLQPGIAMNWIIKT